MTIERTALAAPSRTANVKKILFYNDALGFGGHEIMSLEIIKALFDASPGIQIHYLCGEGSRQLYDEASKVDGLQVSTFPVRGNRFSFMTDLLPVGNVARLRARIGEIAPDCIVAVQGTIGVSYLALVAARRLGIRVVTYIALAQSMRELGIPGFRLRDLVQRRFYYPLPDRFIAISGTQREYLLGHGVLPARIVEIPNVVRLDTGRRVPRQEARAALGLDDGAFCVGLLGRVVASHKGHDYLVKAVAAGRERLAGMRFLLVGDGPDLPRIRREVELLGIEGFFAFLPWSQEMNLVYSALDAVIIPSNHEGVPLVMIEAGLYGVPIVASAIDGMKEFLPGEWLFPRGDVAALTERLLDVAAGNQAERSALVRERFERVFCRTNIGSEFLAELEQVCGGDCAPNRGRR